MEDRDVHVEQGQITQQQIGRVHEDEVNGGLSVRYILGLGDIRGNRLVISHNLEALSPVSELECANRVAVSSFRVISPRSERREGV